MGIDVGPATPQDILQQGCWSERAGLRPAFWITTCAQSHGPRLLRQGGFETRPYMRMVSLMDQIDLISRMRVGIDAEHAAKIYRASVPPPVQIKAPRIRIDLDRHTVSRASGKN